MADRQCSLSCLFRAGVAAGAIAISCVSVSAHAEDQAVAEASELQQYVLRLMLQVYDGTRDLSHTQLLGVGRVRQGDESFTQFDFGDGAVVLSDNGGKLSASRFVNLSGTEKAVAYDYRTGMMSGDKSVTGFHNRIVRPLLGHAPSTGRNASWVSSVNLSALGVPAVGAANVRIELSREYFTYQGKPMVLVHYAIPAFTYTDGVGRQIVHWGQGISLTDPGFGMIYLSSTLQRAVANGRGGSVPYRYARTMVAADADGSALIDYRDVPQLAPYLDDLFSEEAMRVVPTGARSSSSMPIDAARNIDIVALSLAEDAGNEAPMAAGVQLAADHGLEVMSSSMMQQLQAQQAASQQQQMQQQLTSGANTNAQQAQNITNNTSTLVSDMRGQTSLGSGSQTDTTYVGGPTGVTRGGDAGSSITVTGPDGEAYTYALPNVGQVLRLPDGRRVQLGNAPDNGSSGGGSISITGPNGEIFTADLPNVGQELRFPDGSRVQLGNDQQNGPNSGSAAGQALEALGARAATAGGTFGGPLAGSGLSTSPYESTHTISGNGRSTLDGEAGAARPIARSRRRVAGQPADRRGQYRVRRCRRFGVGRLSRSERRQRGHR